MMFGNVLTSCGVSPEAQTITAEDFPLRERWSVTLDGYRIYGLAVSEDWIAASQSNRITALDTKTGKLLWNLSFPVDIDSLLLFVNGNLVVAGPDQMLVIDKTGEELSTISFDPQDERAQIVAAYSNYVFVRRVPSWKLEVYDIQTGIEAWEIAAGRGGQSISFDKSTNSVYLTTASVISSYDISNGNLIRKIDQNTKTGVLDAGVLFTASDANTLQISAVDVNSLDRFWDTPLSAANGVRTTIYNLAVFDNMLIISTNFGLLAIDKKAGHELWQSETDGSFYSAPVFINDVIYERGVDPYTIYAISPTNGEYLGYLRLGKSLLPVSHSEDSIIYGTGELLFFPYKNTVYAYEPK